MGCPELVEEFERKLKRRQEEAAASAAEREASGSTIEDEPRIPSSSKVALCFTSLI